MTTPQTTITIAGLTGRFARLITTHILSKPHVHINGLCRSPSKLPSSLSTHPRLRVFQQADAKDIPALRKALKGASACVCCYLGDNELMEQGQKTLIDACIAENVPRYIAGDWSFDFRKLAYGEHPAKDPMKRVQAYLEEREGKGEIRGVHVLNGAFMEVMFSFLRWYDPVGDKVVYWGSGEERYEMTRYEDAARFTAEVILDEEANGFLNVLGDSISPKQLAVEIKEAYGKEPTLVRLGSQKDLYEKMTAAFKKDPANVYSWMSSYYIYRMMNGQTLLETLDNDRYPDVKPKTVRQFLRDFSAEGVVKSAFF